MDALKTRLAEVLAAYGADPARWPAAERARLQAAIQSEPQLLAEAREIDLVLAKAAAPVIPAGAASRLLARAGQARPALNVVPFDPARRGQGQRQRSIWSWGAAAALAASFACGIFLGTTNFAARLGDSEVVEIDDPIVLTGIDDATVLLEGES
ncbi:hypothetical protein [Taklimakanibacter lacteus]|uniref:hypothetical protein n=1 Tax=Taklimakanibacter lacteus TaxID=2268456 RepID=UPI000E664EAF